MRTRLSRSLRIVVIAVTAAACAGRAPIARSVATLPAALPSCTERTVGPAFQACYDELAEYLRMRTIALADGKPPARIHFSDALGPIVQALVPRLAGGFRMLDDATGNDDAFTSRAPVHTVWSLDGEPATLWACFGGGTVIVVRDACPAVP